jgi:phage anti-repressor protein
MKVTYQTRNYKPEYCMARYLKINHNDEVVIIESNSKHYTIKEYILDESEYKTFKEEIIQAKERQHIYPPFVSVIEDKPLSK